MRQTVAKGKECNRGIFFFRASVCLITSCQCYVLYKSVHKQWINTFEFSKIKSNMPYGVKLMWINSRALPLGFYFAILLTSSLVTRNKHLEKSTNPAARKFIVWKKLYNTSGMREEKKASIKIIRRYFSLSSNTKNDYYKYIFF